MLIRRLHKARNCWVWDVRIYDENGKKRLYPTGHTSKKMAKEYEGRIKNEIAERKMFPERYFPKMKFKDFIPEYLKKHASKKRSYRDYESITKKLGDFFGEFYLHEINRYQVETYYSLRSEKAGVYMVNREITILKGIFTKAIEWGFLRVNPVKGLKLEKEKPRLRFLRTWEISRLIDACGKEPKAPYLTSMVIIDLHSGLRKEGILLFMTNTEGALRILRGLLGLLLGALVLRMSGFMTLEGLLGLCACLVIFLLRHYRNGC